MQAFYKDQPIMGIPGPAGSDGNPIGTIISFMGHVAPKDYLICDGATYNTSDYPELARFFKEQFGSETYFGSNGSGTFAVPDMRNLFLRGYHGASEQLSGEIGATQKATVHPYVIGVQTTKRVGLIGYAATTDDSPGNTATETDTLFAPNKKFAYENKPESGEAPIDVSNDNSWSVSYTSRPVNMAVLYCIKAVKSVSEKRDDGENYSKEEIRIGTWIDGKPLYRRVFDFVTPSTPSSSGKAVFSLASNVEIRKISGVVYGTNGYTYPAPYTSDDGQLFKIYSKNGVDVRISMNVELEHWKNANGIGIIEYTKTTDAVPSAQSTTITSEVLPKSSGSITHDDIEYEYESSNDVSSFGSFAKDIL